MKNQKGKKTRKKPERKRKTRKNKRDRKKNKKIARPHPARCHRYGPLRVRHVPRRAGERAPLVAH